MKAILTTSIVNVARVEKGEEWGHGALERCLNGFATKSYKLKNTSITVLWNAV